MSGQSEERDGAGEESPRFASRPPMEIELKFQVRPSDLAALRASSIFAERPAVTLRSVYFDTADRDLHKAGFSLRVREKGGAYIQTVKSSGGAGLFDRAEWECAIDSERPDRVAWKGTAIASILKGKPTESLIPVFSTTVVRNVGVIEEGENVVELSLDEGDLETANCSEPILELELELKRGDRVALFSIARQLGAGTILALSFDSKAERGYRLAGQSLAGARKASSVTTVAISRRISAAAAFPIVVRDCLTQISANAGLLHDGCDSEVVHQLRVGLRRLRTAFTVFDPILSPNSSARLKAEAKWVAGQLDDARNLDVLIKNLRTGKATSTGDKASRALRVRLGTSRKAAYRRVRSTINSKRFAALLLDCAFWTEMDRDGPVADPTVRRQRDGNAATFASQALEHLRHQLRKQGRHLRKLDPKARHRVRIKAKNLRYGVEFFAECFGHRAQKRSKKFLTSLGKLQDALGELNDLSFAKLTISEAIGDRADTAFGAGQLIAEPDRSASKLLKNAVEAYEGWRRAKPFWCKAHKRSDRALQP